MNLTNHDMIEGTRILVDGMTSAARLAMMTVTVAGATEEAHLFLRPLPSSMLFAFQDVV
jgi:hypothetical protein